MAQPGNPYDALFDEEERRLRAARDVNLRDAAGVNPDQFAEAQRLSRDTGIPSEVVLRNPDDVRRQAAPSEHDALLQQSPQLSNSLTDPDFARLSSDDIPQLAKIEKRAGTIIQFENGRFAGIRSTKDIGEARPVERGALQGLYEPILRGLARVRVSKALLGSEAGLHRGAEAALATRVAQAEREAGRYPVPSALAGQIQEIGRSSTVAEAVSAALRNPRAVLEVALESLGVSSPAMGLALVGSALGPSGTAIGAGLGSFFVEYANTLSDVLAERGTNMSDAQDIADSLANPELMADAREKGVKRGLPIAMFDALTAGFAGVLLRGARATVASIAPRVAGELGLQAAGGAAGEATAQLFTGEYKPGDIVLEALAEIPTGVTEVYGNVRHARAMAEQNAQADRTKRGAEALKDLLALGAESKLRERAPDTYAAFVQAAHPEGFVYVDGATFAQAAAEAGLDVPTLMPETAAALQDAVTTQSDVRIPLGEFAAAIPGTTLEQSIIPKLRVDASAPTQEELADKRYVEETKARIEKITAEAQFDTAWKESAVTVRKELLTQLNNAARFTPEVNELKAAYAAAMYATQARRLGITPEEMYVRHPLDIVARSVLNEDFTQFAPARFADFAPGRVKDILQRADWTILTAENPNAQPLPPEQNASRMVELKAFLTAQGLPFTEVKGKYGNEENSLLITGTTPQQALEIGKRFGQESVLTPQGLVYQDGSVNPATGVTEHTTLPEDFYSVVPSTGAAFSVDIDFDKKVPLTSVLHQPEDQTQTPAFKSWFGNSKVVDAQGRPLVVYHGTAGDFSVFNPTKGDSKTFGGQNLKDSGVVASFFTDSPSVASGFAESAENAVVHANVRPVYLSLKNPYVIQAEGEQWGRFQTEIVEVYKSGKYDGIMVHNVQDGMFDEELSNIYVAFRPEQIKSAIGNRGTFDPNDPNILHQIVGRSDEWAYSELARQIDALTEQRVPKDGLTPAQWKALIIEPASTKTVALRDAKNKATGETKQVAVAERVLLPGVKPAEIEATGILDWLDAMAKALRSQEGMIPEVVEQRKKWRVIQEQAGHVVGYYDTEQEALAAVDAFDVKRGPTAIAYNVSYRALAPLFASEKVTKQMVQQFLKDNQTILDERILTKTSGDPEDSDSGEIEFSETNPETDEPDDSWLAENAADSLSNDKEEILDKAAAEKAIEDGVDVDDIDRDALWDEIEDKELERYIDREREYYYEDSDSPQSSTATLTTGDGTEYDFDVNYGYGEVYISYNGREVYQGSLRRTSVESEIREWAADHLDLYEHSDDSDDDSGTNELQYASHSYQLEGPRSDDVELLLKWPGMTLFTSGHFGDVSDKGSDNVIVHFRANSRIVSHNDIRDSFPELTARLEAEGKRANVFFVEEIQSDWAQKGRDEGFENTLTPAEEKRLAELEAKVERTGNDLTGDELDEATELQTRKSRGGGVKRAPFVTKSDAVNALAMKRIIRYATEQGADLVAWTRGDQQVERWRNALRKQVQVIDWTKTEQGVQLVGYKRYTGGGARIQEVHIENGVRHAAYPYRQLPEGVEVEFDIYDADGNEFITGLKTIEEAEKMLAELPDDVAGRNRRGQQVVDTTYKESALSDAIGKLMAGKILGDANQTGTLQGDDITIDDIGMSQVYGDEHGKKGDGTPAMIPKVTQEILKKMGGGKLGKLWLGRGTTIEPATPVYVYDGPDFTLREVEEMYRRVEDTDAWHSPSGWKNGLRFILKIMKEGVDNDGIVRPWGIAVQEAQRITAENGNGDAGIELLTSLFASDIMLRPGATIRLERTEPEQVTTTGGTLQPAFELTPSLKEKSMAGVPLFQQARGQITFREGMPAQIALLANANLSTFFHEMGHFYLEVLTDMAALPEAPQEIKDDLAIVLRWFNLTEDEWRSMEITARKPYHEQWARGNEAYLFEGKAPSAELMPLFRRFRAWMLNVYKLLTGGRTDSAEMQDVYAKSLGETPLQLTDEVRGVLDRMLATNDEIVEAEASRSMLPVFDEKPETETEQAWKELQALGQEATQEAVDQLQTRSLRDMQYASNARSQVLKRLQAQAAAQRRIIRREVTTEVMAEPIHQVRRFLRTGRIIRPDGEEVKTDGSFKLDKALLAEMYPEGMDTRPDISTLQGLTAKDGLQPQTVADLFGFTSADEMVRLLVYAEPAKVQIDALTDQRMLERYGDLADPASIARAADEAVHNDVRTRFVATELHMLEKAVGQRRSIIPAAKEFAGTLVARKRIRDIKPGEFAANEARNGKAAERARVKGDLALAAAEKRKQIVNLYATKAAYTALADVDKGVAYLKRVAESRTIDPEYRSQIAGLLERFDLRTVTNREAARRQSLVQWIEAQRAAGNEPVIDPALENEANRKPYREMTAEEFQGLVDSVKNIEHLGRLKNRLLTARDNRAFAAVVQDITESIEANAKRDIPVKLERNRWTDKAKVASTKFFAMHRKLSSMLREIDGYNDNGVLTRVVTHSMNRAGDAETVMREQATVALTELLKPLRKLKMTETLFIPAIGDSLSREGRIMVALNTGNEGNLQRLRDGDGWTDAQVQAIVDTLTKPEMDFVQGVWNFVGSYRTRIGEQQKRLTGVEPDWVQPREVVTPHGTYAGGYLPAKYDTSRSTRAMADEAAAGLLDQWRAKYGASAARASFTKERAKQVVNRPLRKDFGVIFQHVTEVSHRLAWQDWLVDVNRLLRAKPVDASIRAHYGPEVLEAIRDTVEDIAAGEVMPQNVFESVVNHVRHGATIAGLGWRLTTSLLQPIGLTQSMVRIGPRWVAQGIAEWIGDAAHMENTAARIYAKSDMMRLRGKTMQREINEIRNQIAGKSSAVEASYFYMIQKMQLVADIPTWLGQYSKAIESGADEDTAVSQADQAVLEAQGGGQIKDLAAIQRGSPYLRLWTNFYSFFNTTYNLTREAVGRTDFKDPLAIGRLAVDFLLLYSVPAALGTLMKWSLGDDDDEDKLIRNLIAEQMNYLLGTIVGLREIGGAVRGALGLPGDYGGPAGLRFFTEIAKLGKQIGQGEVDEALLKALNSVGGILFHYPAGQINATFDGILAMMDGRTDNPGVLAVGSSKQ